MSANHRYFGRHFCFPFRAGIQPPCCILTLGFLCLVIFIAPSVLAQSQTDEPADVETQDALDFNGHWETNHGVVKLNQDGNTVNGSYENETAIGNLEGKAEGDVVNLRFDDNNQKGEARFELSEDGNSFSGAWRAEGEFSWRQWNGRRVASPGFGGLWETRFGKMRLFANGDEICGTYNFQGGESTIEGQLKGKRFIFRYKEPNDVEGAAWFELSEDGNSLTGKYRPDGGRRWDDWTGERIKPEEGRVWLVILEANWETSLDEPQYAFAEMLEEYFTMATARHVDVRRRTFHDSVDLQRFCKQVKYIPGEVVLLISTHGSREGITVLGETIRPDVLANCLAGTPNIELLHLSGCSMMSGSFPAKLHALLENEPKRFPVTGYTTVVGWDASALGDFTFLSMLLIHRLEPEAAVREAIRVSPHLGDERIRGSVYRPLGLTIEPVPEVEHTVFEQNTESASSVGADDSGR